MENQSNKENKLNIKKIAIEILLGSILLLVLNFHFHAFTTQDYIKLTFCIVVSNLISNSITSLNKPEKD